jgi:hypothetical protein
MTASRELYIDMDRRMILDKYLLWYRFKHSPSGVDHDHTMGRYRSICDFGIFVNMYDVVPEKVKTLDFDELTKLHASLPHLQSRST